MGSRNINKYLIEPNNAEYHNDLGITLYKMKRYDEAFIIMQKAVELEPDNAEYQENLNIAKRKI